MKTNHTPHLQHAIPDQRPASRAWLLVWLLVLAILPNAAAAQGAVCWFEDSGGNPINAPAVQNVTMNPITVPLPSNPSAGSPIGNPVSATVNGATIYINCGFNSTTGGLSPAYGTYDPTNNIIYSPTPGVAFQIQRSGNPIPIYSTDSYSGSMQFSNTTTFQLFSTGVLPSNGNQIPAGTLLGQWEMDSICIKNPKTNNSDTHLKSCGTSANAYAFINFISGGVTFTATTCTVSTGSQNLVVTLPPVLASSLTSTGTTAGTTPFSINLTGCTSNRNVSATLNTNSPYASANGVIAPTTGSGYAGNVGIRLLQSDDATPVAFGTAFPVGTTSGANFTFNLYAQYYQTASPVTPGQVQATATYTLTYQ